MTSSTNAEEAIVYVVDDDESVRSALEDLLGSVGLKTRAFPSAETFAASPREERPACLILDIRMRGMSGLDWQQKAIAADDRLPIIFITGHGDVNMSVKAMKGGAIEFLTKPFRDQDLLDAIQDGLARSRTHRAHAADIGQLQGRYATLDARERQIMGAVIAGEPNRQIADGLNLSEITIKVRRRQIMLKMGASSLPDLVRMAIKLGIGHNEHPDSPD